MVTDCVFLARQQNGVRGEGARYRLRDDPVLGAFPGTTPPASVVSGPALSPSVPPLPPRPGLLPGPESATRAPWHSHTVNPQTSSHNKAASRQGESLLPPVLDSSPLDRPLPLIAQFS